MTEDEPAPSCNPDAIRIILARVKRAALRRQAIDRVLEQRGMVERDMQNAWLATQGAEGPVDDLIGYSTTCRIAVGPRTGQKLERLCRYVSCPPIAVERLALTSSGQVRYQLKTACRDGTTHIVLDPMDLMARLAALVPPSTLIWR